MKFKQNLLHSAIVAAIGMPAVALASDSAADDAYFDLGGEGEYLSGDFHNHTSCSDGSTSVRTLTRKSLTYHDWFIHVGHSGRGPRDCRVDDFLYQAQGGGARVGLWSNSGAEVKGDPRTRTFNINSYDETGAVVETVQQTVQDMWRWQSLQEFNLGGIVDEREFPGNDDKIAFMGLEWVVPGHEHSSNTLITGQYDETPKADALAQFEYCFARNSDDTSQGGGQNWTCEVSAENNDKLIALFGGRPEEGTADYNSTLSGDGINIDDSGEHVKAAAAALWMEEQFPGEGMAVQAHVERQGAFLPGQNRGWNVEHMRDMHTLAPEVAFGFESQPGHQAQPNRGSYSGGRPTAGFWTYGGTGAYGGAEVSRPGLDFDGNPIDPATTPQCLEPGVNCSNVPRTVLSRPGVRTMWDALLSEGRRFWFFGSSDWHNRGAFGPLDFESTNDFWPGEYQDNFTYVVRNNPENPAQDIVDGLRSGNTYVVNAQLVDKLKFEACARGQCATMGETLNVREGDRVRVTLTVRDPDASNNSPYAFPNPIDKSQMLDNPVLKHVEFIYGEVGEPVEPYLPTGERNPDYFDPMAPDTTRIVRQFTESDYGTDEIKSMSWSFRASTDAYVRARGGNVPAGTPNAVDVDGNPLADNLRDNIPCDDPLCPPHVNGIVDFGLEAWADAWIYTNPIFVEVQARPGRGRMTQAAD